MAKSPGDCRSPGRPVRSLDRQPGALDLGLRPPDVARTQVLGRGGVTRPQLLGTEGSYRRGARVIRGPFAQTGADLLPQRLGTQGSAVTEKDASLGQVTRELLGCVDPLRRGQRPRKRARDVEDRAVEFTAARVEHGDGRPVTLFCVERDGGQGRDRGDGTRATEGQALDGRDPDPQSRERARAHRDGEGLDLLQRNTGRGKRGVDTREHDLRTGATGRPALDRQQLAAAKHGGAGPAAGGLEGEEERGRPGGYRPLGSQSTT